MNATLNAQGRLRPTPEKRGNFFPGPAESPAGRPKEDVGMCVLSCTYGTSRYSIPYKAEWVLFPISRNTRNRTEDAFKRHGVEWIA